MQGGRDAHALQARAVRRLEARAAGERRQAGEAPFSTIPSLTTLQLDEATSAEQRTQLLGPWLRTAFDAVLRRSGRTRRR